MDNKDNIASIIGMRRRYLTKDRLIDKANDLHTCTKKTCDEIDKICDEITYKLDVNSSIDYDEETIREALFLIDYEPKRK